MRPQAMKWSIFHRENHQEEEKTHKEPEEHDTSHKEAQRQHVVDAENKCAGHCKQTNCFHQCVNWPHPEHFGVPNFRLFWSLRVVEDFQRPLPDREVASGHKLNPFLLLQKKDHAGRTERTPGCDLPFAGQMNSASQTAERW